MKKEKRDIAEKRREAQRTLLSAYKDGLKLNVTIRQYCAKS